MVRLQPPITEGTIASPIRSSFYHDVLKKSGKLKSEETGRNRTSSYDKHFLVHTDITGSGRGNSYPHRKDFAWNLLYLKQSWGANLNSPHKKSSSSSSSPSPKRKVEMTRSDSRKSYASEGKQKHRFSSRRSVEKKPHSAPNKSFLPLQSLESDGNFRSAISDATGFAERKRRNTGSERSRVPLDSIPENAPLPLSPSRVPQTEASFKRRHESPSVNGESRRSRRSNGSHSKMSLYSSTPCSSSYSSQLPDLKSRNGRSIAPQSGITTRSYGDKSRASSVTSQATRWDEHEGRPFAEKMFAKVERERKVANTIRPEVIKNLVSAVTHDLNSSSHASSHLDSSSVGSTLNGNYSVKKHQPFTNLKFEVENSAKTSRLRSSLYKTEEAQRKPTIFRDNLTDNRKQKAFNPRFHGDITRPSMVEKHSHKHALEGFSPAKWVPKLNSLSEKGDPWTTYEAH